MNYWGRAASKIDKESLADRQARRHAKALEVKRRGGGVRRFLEGVSYFFSSFFFAVLFFLLLFLPLTIFFHLFFGSSEWAFFEGRKEEGVFCEGKKRVESPG